MATLAQVMIREVGEQAFCDSEAFPLRDEEVVMVRLATGAPCAGHASLFEPWPGPQRHVARWFQLADGHAVGLAEPPAGPQQVHVWKMARDHT